MIYPSRKPTITFLVTQPLNVIPTPNPAQTLTYPILPYLFLPFCRQVSGSEELSALMTQTHRYGHTHLQCLCEAFLCRQAYMLHCEYHQEHQRRREQRWTRQQQTKTTTGSEGGVMEVEGANGLPVDEDGGVEEEEEDPIVSLVSC